MSQQTSPAERPHLANDFKSTAAQLARKVLDFKAHVDELHQFMCGGPDNGSVHRRLKMFAEEVEACQKELKIWNNIYSTQHYLHQHHSRVPFDIQTIAHQALHFIRYTQDVSSYGFDRAMARQTWAQLLFVMYDRFLRDMQTLRLLAGGYVSNRETSHGRSGLLPQLPTTGTLSSLAAASSQHGARMRSGEEVPGDATRSLHGRGTHVVRLNGETLAHGVKTEPLAGADFDTSSRPPPIPSSPPTLPTQQASSTQPERIKGRFHQTLPVSGPGNNWLTDQYSSGEQKAMSRQETDLLNLCNASCGYALGREERDSIEREIGKRSGVKPSPTDAVPSLTHAVILSDAEGDQPGGECSSQGGFDQSAQPITAGTRTAVTNLQARTPNRHARGNRELPVPLAPGANEVATTTRKRPHPSPPLGWEASTPRRQKKSRGTLRERSSGIWE